MEFLKAEAVRMYFSNAQWDPPAGRARPPKAGGTWPLRSISRHSSLKPEIFWAFDARGPRGRTSGKLSGAAGTASSSTASASKSPRQAGRFLPLLFPEAFAFAEAFALALALAAFDFAEAFAFALDFLPGLLPAAALLWPSP